MSITINGTTGIAGVDGSAATPSVQGADANTGVFFPAADTVAVTTGGTERMRVDSSGNVGIGTSSPDGKIDIQMSSMDVVAGLGGNYPMWTYRNGSGSWFHAGKSPSADAFVITTGATPVTTEYMRIDASGNVGIGTSSPSNKLDVSGVIGLPAATTEGRSIEIGGGRTGNGYAYIDFIGDATYTDFGLRIIRENNGANAASSIAHRGTGALALKTEEAAVITFSTAATERMRIDASGQALFGLTSSIGTGVAQFRGGIRGDNSSGDANFAIESRSGGTLYSSSIYNSTTATGASVSITGTAGFLQRSTSSIKYKTDVEDLDQSLSANIYKMRPVWYRSKCEMDRKDWSYLGLIAEEVAEIEPRLVHWGEVKEDGTQEPEGVMYDRLTVLLLAEVKKQQQMIQALQADIAALKGV
jgi:hypothetical protein